MGKCRRSTRVKRTRIPSTRSILVWQKWKWNRRWRRTTSRILGNEIHSRRYNNTINNKLWYVSSTRSSKYKKYYIKYNNNKCKPNSKIYSSIKWKNSKRNNRYNSNSKYKFTENRIQQLKRRRQHNKRNRVKCKWRNSRKYDKRICTSNSKCTRLKWIWQRYNILCNIWLKWTRT